MKHTIADVIHMAGHLIDTEKRRCVEMQAQDMVGLRTTPFKSAACKWCVAGALLVSGVKLGYFDPNSPSAPQVRLWNRLLKRAAIASDCGDAEGLIWTWNNGLKAHRDRISKALRETP